MCILLVFLVTWICPEKRNVSLFEVSNIPGLWMLA